MRSERRGGLINCLLGSFRICLIEPSRAGSRRIFVLPQEQKLNAGAWRVLFTQETPAGHAVRKGVACVRRARVQLLRECKRLLNAGRFSCASAPYLPDVFANNSAREQSSRELETRLAAGSVRRPLASLCPIKPVVLSFRVERRSTVSVMRPSPS
jgi:hypothetical protein